MSIELDPLTLEYHSVAYQVFFDICEEFTTQVNHVRIVRICDQKEVAPKDFEESVVNYKDIYDKALALAQAKASDIEAAGITGDMVIDYADCAGG